MSLGAAAAAGNPDHRPGGVPGSSVLQAAADAFVSGADRAVLAGAIVVAAGLVVASRAFRPARVSMARVSVARVSVAGAPVAVAPVARALDAAPVAEVTEVPVLEAVGR